MSSRTIIVLTLIVGFAVFFIVMWQRYSVDPPPPIVAERAPVVPQMAAPPIPAVPQVAQQLPAAADTARDPAAQSYRTVEDSASGSSAPVEGALPVQVRFRHINNLVLGTIVNESNAQLSVEVIDRQSGTQTTLDLDPRIPAMIGVRDGLELHSGDEVAVRGASYRELVTKVQ
jgi:hypothetical protein